MKTLATFRCTALCTAAVLSLAFLSTAFVFTDAPDDAPAPDVASHAVTDAPFDMRAQPVEPALSARDAYDRAKAAHPLKFPGTAFNCYDLGVNLNLTTGTYAEETSDPIGNCTDVTIDVTVHGGSSNTGSLWFKEITSSGQQTVLSYQSFGPGNDQQTIQFFDLGLDSKLRIEASKPASGAPYLYVGAEFY